MRYFAPALILVLALAGCGAPAPPEFYARAWKATAHAHKRITEVGGYGQMQGEDLIAEALERAAFFTAGAAATRASVAEADSLAAEALDAAAEGRKRLRGGGIKATRKTAKTLRKLSEQLRRRSAAVAAIWEAEDYSPLMEAEEQAWVLAGQKRDEAWAAAAEATARAAEAVDAAAAVLEAEE